MHSFIHSPRPSLLHLPIPLPPSLLFLFPVSLSCLLFLQLEALFTGQLMKRERGGGVTEWGTKDTGRTGGGGGGGRSVIDCRDLRTSPGNLEKLPWGPWGDHSGPPPTAHSLIYSCVFQWGNFLWNLRHTVCGSLKLLNFVVVFLQVL